MINDTEASTAVQNSQDEPNTYIRDRLLSQDSILDNENLPQLNTSPESDLEDEEIDSYDRKEWDKFYILESKMCPMSQRRYKEVTKHSVVMNKSNNGYKLLTFPPAFRMNKRISSKNINSYCPNLSHKQNQEQGHGIKEPIIIESKIDDYAQFIIYKMINNKLLGKVNSLISVGNMAFIFHAMYNPLHPNAAHEFSGKCVIKVFHLTSSKPLNKLRKEFVKKYLTGKETKKKTIQLWAEREASSMKLLANSSVCCPRLIKQKNHVVVMSFIGEHLKPAQSIIGVKFTTEEYVVVYKQIVEAMKEMYRRNVIHGSLSEKAILWHEKTCYFVDFSQSLKRSDESAFHALYRDCSNITNFFEQKGVPNIMTACSLFEEITGFYYYNKFELMKFIELFKGTY